MLTSSECSLTFSYFILTILLSHILFVNVLSTEKTGVFIIQIICFEYNSLGKNFKVLENELNKVILSKNDWSRINRFV